MRGKEEGGRWRGQERRGVCVCVRVCVTICLCVCKAREKGGRRRGGKKKRGENRVICQF